MEDKGTWAERGAMCRQHRGFPVCPIGPRTFFLSRLGCTLLRGYSCLPNPKPTISGWLFQIITSSHWIHTQEGRPLR